MLVLNHDQVLDLLPPAAAIEVMAGAMAALARGEADQPPRLHFRPAQREGLMLAMPAFVHQSGSPPYFGLKTLCIFPGNPARGLDAHQGAVMLFNGETGEALALINAPAITARRTAAVSAVATRALARPDAAVLALIGAGVQARAHLSAIACVRDLREVRVTSPDGRSARRLAEDLSPGAGCPIRPVPNAAAAVRGADIIVTATTSPEPVIRREWLAPGGHINAVGAYTATTRELDSATVAGARLYVDRRESARLEAGDYLIPLGEGVIGPDHVRGELGDLLIGRIAGRTSPEEITLFKSLGLAIQDLTAAAYIYRVAREQGVGVSVTLD